MNKAVAITIGGSDPSAGAGIQADCKAFSSIGVHGFTVLTSITSQNTQQVTNVFAIPAEVVVEQITTLLQDVKVFTVKTGMLFSKSIIKSVSECLTKDITIVVDPVMASTTGGALSDESYLDALKQYVLPIASVVTPNKHEAELLTGKTLVSLDDMHDACQIIHEYGVEYVVLKGGHFIHKNAVDVLFDGKDFFDLSLPFHLGKKAHGSGCTFSALIAGFLALGYKPLDAIKHAKCQVWSMIRESYHVGGGVDLVQTKPQHLLPISFINSNDVDMWCALSNAVTDLLVFLPSEFIAEVGMNIGYARAKASCADDVCAVDGRISAGHQQVYCTGSFRFGGSQHIARVILAAMTHDASLRSAINLRFSNQLLSTFEDHGFSIGFFDRKNEPKNTSSTMEWGTDHAFIQCKQTLDVIYDKGGFGKEPMIRVLGKNPQEVTSKVKTVTI